MWHLFVMGPEELALLTVTETDKIEWKQSLRDGDAIRRAVCALANDLGGSGDEGHVLVGVAPDGSVVGIETARQTIDEAQQALANRLHDITLQPTPSIAVSAVQADAGRNVLVVNVQPYAVPPVVTFRGTAWVRIGTTTRRATDADLARLGERQPENRRPFDDLETRALKDQYEAASIGDDDPDSFPELQHWLFQQELGREVQGAFVPNTTAVLVFGRSPQTYFPGARALLGYRCDGAGGVSSLDHWHTFRTA
jgi:ATP-dependent DNA helicase RecG